MSTSRSSSLLFIVFIVLGSSCAHVSFPPLPAATAPEAERQAAYAQVAPEYEYGTEPSSDVFDGVLLKNGARVRQVEDLLPLVDPDSATARSIALSQSALKKWVTLASIAFSVLAVGAAVTLYGALNLNTGALGAGYATMAVSLVPAAFAGPSRVTYTLERASAMVTYADDVRRRLAVKPPTPDSPAAPAAPPTVRWLPSNTLLGALR